MIPRLAFGPFLAPAPQGGAEVPESLQGVNVGGKRNHHVLGRDPAQVSGIDDPVDRLHANGSLGGREPQCEGLTGDQR